MTNLQFERIAQIIAIAAVGGDKGISTFFIKGTIEIRFSEYVKSQVHLNVVHGLYNRSLKEYVETLYFLRGKSSNRSSALKVLRYFYEDLSNFLINNGEEIHLIAVVDSDMFGLPKVKCSVDELKSELLSEFNSILDGSLTISGWKFASILDYAKGADDVKEKAGSYATAWFFKSQNDNLSIVESG